ncbi:MAG TPA: bifunctional phosphoglucose/phosphomannose isomerase, partial [Thermoplasmatales archaeon]|nr:bifunctional phosphoglucose/phosphomannose isomerase [Thermoplasmatales archaeon]
MLDNLEYISRFDRSGMLDTISKLPEQIEQALEICRDIEVEAGEIENILISGMGGSAISGD